MSSRSSRINSSGAGLLAIFGTPEKSVNELRTSKAVAERSLSVRSKKRSRSLMTTSGGSLGSFALMSVSTDEKIDRNPLKSTTRRSNVRSVTRKRSRPRETDRLRKESATTCRTPSGLARPSLTNSTKNERHQEDRTPVRNEKIHIEEKQESKAESRIRIPPRRSRYNPPRRIILESSDESDIDNSSDTFGCFDSPAVDPITAPTRTKEDPPPNSLTSFNRKSTISNLPEAQSRDSETSCSYLETLLTKKNSSDSHRKRTTLDKDTFQCSLTSIFEADRHVQPVVTPSPKKKANANSASSTKGYNTANDERRRKQSKSDRSVNKSIGSANNPVRLKRVSRLKINAKKKPKVVLTRAMTVGRKTIPGRQIIKPAKKPKAKATAKHSLINLKQNDHRKLLMKEKKSRRVTKSVLVSNGSNGSNEEDFDGQTSNDNDTFIISSTEEESLPDKGNQSSKAVPKAALRKKASDLIRARKNGVDSTTVLRKKAGVSLHVRVAGETISTKKMELLDFIDKMMVDLKGIKVQIQESEDSDMVGVKDLQEEFYVLTEDDIFYSKGAKSSKSRNSVASKASRRKLTFNSKRKNSPSPRVSSSTSIGRWQNDFTLPPPIGPTSQLLSNWEEESECSYDSVIDLGIVSDSRALVRYAEENASSNYYDDDESSGASNSDVDASGIHAPIAKPNPSQSRSSRLNTSSSILASLGILRNTENSDNTSKLSNPTPLTKAKEHAVTESSSVASKSVAKHPSSKAKKVPSLEAAIIPKTTNPMEALLAIDWDECLDQELEKRALQRSTKICDLEEEGVNGNNDGEDDSSSSGGSSLDAMMMGAPILAF